MTTGKHIHKLAQAAQLGDLLAERADQFLELLAELQEEMPFEGSAADYQRFEMVRSNLVRQVGAYRSVRS